jgi:hypothetical protein
VWLFEELEKGLRGFFWAAKGQWWSMLSCVGADLQIQGVRWARNQKLEIARASSKNEVGVVEEDGSV